MTTTNSGMLVGGGLTAPQPLPKMKINPATLSLEPKATPEGEPAEQPALARGDYILKYSLRGLGSELAASAAKVEPLLGNVCLRGEATMWYARPNAGKTLLAISLILDAIDADRIQGDSVIYVNMDDNSEGLAQKVRILEDHGVHVIAPGHKGFTPAKLIPALDEMVERGSVHGLLMVIDTVKKVTDLMDKRRASEFTAWARRFVQKGGTLLGLAHTNKKAGADGKPVYAGTTDLVDDFDCAYSLAERPETTSAGHRIVEFSNYKRRGNAAERAVYGYNAKEGISYDDRLSSVEALNDVDFDPLVYTPEIAEAAVAAAIAQQIKAGVVQKMALMKAVQAEHKLSRRTVQAVLEQWTGRAWDFDVKDRGAKVYRIIEHPKPAPTQDPG